MLPFSLALRPGEPVVDQVVYAVTRAVVSGQLRPGDRFPSVRTLSQELKVNPNTAQRIVALLVGGRAARRRARHRHGGDQPPTAKAARPTAARRADLAALEDRLAEPLVVEARRLGLGLADLVDIVRAAGSGWIGGTRGGVDGPRDRDRRLTCRYGRTRAVDDLTMRVPPAASTRCSARTAPARRRRSRR